MQQSCLEIERPDIQDAMPLTAELQSKDEAKRILIVDDDPSVLRLVSDHCARIGLSVATAATGMQAFLKASRSKPDILIIDVNMPELDGLSVCAHLMAHDRAPSGVIVITGSRNPDTVNRCEGLGAHYARKGPNFWSDLEAALEAINPSLSGKVPQAGPAELAPAHIRRRPCVLLVDDDSDIHKLLGSRLQKCGIDIVFAADAYSAFRIASQSEPAVIVTDYFMPDGDGEYLLKLLRTEEATSTIPVIVLTGRQLSESVDQRLRREIRGHAGAAHVLRKSEDNAALFETLNQFCGFEPERTRSADIRLGSGN
jgi:CheY-like chemotaxis protein